MLSAALRYAERGWSVFPCTPNDKTPLTPNGLHDATKDEDAIYAFWERHPLANVGIRTGQVSGFVVLDLDKKHGGFESLEHLPEPLPTTFTVATGGGGLHYFFKCPYNGEALKNRVGIFPGLDFRGDGGYVIGAPSIHSSGEPYRVVVDTDLADLPSWLYGLLSNEGRKNTLVSSSGSAPVPEGGRNDYLTRLAGTMQRRGLSKEALTAALLAENQTRCTPPLPDSEVHRIATNIAKYVPENPIQIFNHDTTLSVTARDLTQLTIEFLKDKARVKGEPTGILGLDELLGGGKRLGEVTAWHAEAKTGKNTLWHKLMHIWLEKGIPLGYACRELTPESEVLPDLLSIQFQENARLADIDSERGKRYAEALERWGHLYFAQGYGYFPVEEFTLWVEELVKQGVKYFWFDHLHYALIEPEEHKEAAKLARTIKSLAKNLNVHFDLIIQPNKLQEGQFLSLNSIKGGAAIGQAIDNLIVLERMKEAKNMMKLTVKAGRGKLCKPGSIYFQYDPETIDSVEVQWTAPVSLTDTMPQLPSRPFKQQYNNSRPGYHDYNDDTRY